MLQSLVLYLGTPSYHVLSLILASTAALQSLIALWAATSSRHWFWRALAIWCAVMALVPIRAYQPAVIFSISSLLIVAILAMRRFRLGGNRPAAADSASRHLAQFRFGLSDIFLVMIVMGLWLAGMLHIQQHLERFNVGSSVATAAAMAVVAVGAWATARTPRRALRGLLLVVSIATFAVLIPLLGNTYDYYEFWSVVNVAYHPSFLMSDFVRITETLGITAFLIVSVLAVVRPVQPSHATPPLRGLRRAVLLAMLITVLCPLAFIYNQMLSLAPLPPRFSNGTNHFDRLMVIAKQTKGLLVAAPTTTQQARNDLIAESTKLAKASNYVPDESHSDTVRQVWSDTWPDGATLRDYARVIDGEVSAAISRGDWDQACELTETNLRLGVMVQRGGLIAEYLVGVAVTGLALQRIADVRRDISPAEARRLIAAWERVLSEREDTPAVLARDRAVCERIYGWGARLTNVVESAGIRSESHFFLRASLRQETPIRLLQTDLAIRLYEREHGELPQSLDQLVPGYLPELPRDPYSASAQPLRYRVEGGDFILYSGGNDGTDNGGRLTNFRTFYWHNGSGHYGAGYDYDLDTQTRP